MIWDVISDLKISGNNPNETCEVSAMIQQFLYISLNEGLSLKLYLTSK